MAPPPLSVAVPEVAVPEVAVPEAAAPDDSTVTAGEVVRLALLDLLEAIVRHEEGVRRDLDGDALHDLRVAVRRSRSILGQVRGVFPRAALNRWKAELAWLGRRTAERRDWDVLQQALAADLASLAPAVGRDLGPLLFRVAERRAASHARLVRDLTIPRYRRLVAGWRSFLEGYVPEDGPATPNASRPAAEVGAKRIRRLHRRLSSRGAELGPADDADLHRLRILAKKLRYLLELFRDVLDAERVDRLVGELKGIQDLLGRHHDATVQEATLTALAGELAAPSTPPPSTPPPSTPPPSTATLLAIGRLVERRAAIAEAARAELAETGFSPVLPALFIEAPQDPTCRRGDRG